MDMENIEDLPSQGEGDNWTDKVLSYNLNDVLATEQLYYRTLPMIQLRKDLSKMYKINCLNYSNTKIGSEILLKLYCYKTGKLPSDIKSLRTYRPVIKMVDVIFDYIHFNSLELQNFLTNLKTTVINSTKKTEDISIKYKGFELVYGKGGIHGSLNNTIVKSNEEYIIKDCDVSSLYPSIACVNRMYPQHLGPEFYEIYKNDIVNVRISEKKKKDKGNKAIVDGFKEAANATYGLSNNSFSWLYDPLYSMRTTINGQLMITMLVERLLEIPTLSLIQVNTDGITVRLKREHEKEYYRICSEWAELTKLELEFVDYSRMIIRDVNNYIAIYQDTTKKSKCKGFFEFENIPLHKNKSFSIIPYAVHEYFVKGTPIEDTIYNHKNIFDFCGGVKSSKSEKNGRSHYELHSIKDGELFKRKLSKTVRYYISTKGEYLFKVYESGAIEHVEAPKMIGKYSKSWKVTYFNNFYSVENFKDYNIDYTYYISKTRETILELENNLQLNLFQL